MRALLGKEADVNASRRNDGVTALMRVGCLCSHRCPDRAARHRQHESGAGDQQGAGQQESTGEAASGGDDVASADRRSEAEDVAAKLDPPHGGADAASGVQQVVGQGVKVMPMSA